MTGNQSVVGVAVCGIALGEGVVVTIWVGIWAGLIAHALMNIIIMKVMMVKDFVFISFQFYIISVKKMMVKGLID